MTATLKAVLLDLDGTLVDSAEDLRTSLNEILAGEGLRPVDGPEVRAMIGDGALKLVERGLALTGGDVARAPALTPAYLAAYRTRTGDQTTVYEGVLETLPRLAAAGLKLAVVTNKPEAHTVAVLDTFGLARFLDAVVGGDTLPERKPDPAPVREALRRLGILPEEAVMVGDNHHDIAAARGAGVRAIIVSYGYVHGVPAELGADRVIDRFGDLPAVLAAFGAPRIEGAASA